MMTNDELINEILRDVQKAVNNLDGLPGIALDILRLCAAGPRLMAHVDVEPIITSIAHELRQQKCKAVDRIKPKE